MQIGIFTKVFMRDSLDETLDAVLAHGIRAVQFNMLNAGLDELPEVVPAEVAARIREAFAQRAMNLAAVSGTFNIIDPDRRARQDGMRRLAALAGACDALGTRIITMSSGTRDPHNMWRRHADNDTPAAWSEMIASMREATRIAEAHDVTLVVEPEVGNVVNSARKARDMLDTIGSPQLKIVIDGANLFPAGTLPRMAEILDEAFALLGPNIAFAHAKDLSHDGDAGHEAAGTGLLDYAHYTGLLRSSGYAGPLVLHSLTEDQVGECVRFLERHGCEL
jgi:sugar phosphate isomerase/epimerase